MLAVVFMVLWLWATTIVNGVREQHQQLAEVYQAKQKLRDMTRVAEALESYYRENNVLPASLAALTATSGFEDVASSLNTWQGYGVSPALTDGTWTFRRAVAFTNDPSTGVSISAYLAQNACGTNGYDTEIGSWCGAKTSQWFVKDTRQQLNDQIVTERAHLNRLSQKFADYFNTNGTYPDKDPLNVALATSSITPLANLAGYAGTAKNCAGQYQYRGIPIDCSDMFDMWGGAIGYQFEGANHIILVSEPPVFNATNARVVIAADRA